MFSKDLNYLPTIIIVDSDNPTYNDLNLQIDDLEKMYELECVLKLKSVTALLENGVNARHQYLLEIQDINKFKLETD